MKSGRIRYLLSGIVLSLVGIFLIYDNSLGKYFDPLVSRDSQYKGHLSEWFVIIGIAMILLGIIIIIMSFRKEDTPDTRKDKKENTAI